MSSSGRNRRTAPSSARAAALVAAALAAPVAAQDDGALVLDTIAIETTGERGDGPVDGYRAQQSTTATRTDTPLAETPASVTVVPEAVSEDRNATTTAEALALAPSVTQRQNFDGFEAFAIRGFYLSENGFQLDGLTTANLVQFDPALFSRVEVLKGPASILYGAAEPGGIVNFVTPRPTEEPFRAATLTLGSYGEVGGAFDASFDLGRGIGLRTPFVLRRYDSFRNYVNDNEYLGASPSITVPLGERTTARLSTVFIDQDIADDTVAIPLGADGPVDIPRRRFLGVPGARQKDRLWQTALSVEQRFGSALTWTTTASWLDTHADRDTVANVFGVQPDGALGRLRVFGTEDQDRLQLRSELVAEGRLLGADHTLLAGVEYARARTRLENSDQQLAPIDIFDPVLDPVVTASGVVFDDYTVDGDTRSWAVYLQDQATLVADRPGVHRLIAVAGLRYDSYKQEYRTGGRLFGTPSDDDETNDEHKLSPRLGLVWMPTPDLSLYAAYARSFQPQEIATIASVPPEPQEGESYEAGVKLAFARGLSVTGSVFDITKTNVPGPSPIPGVTELTGEERSRGFELEVAGEIRPGWQVIGGYAYTDAEIVDGDPAVEGDTLFSAPRHRASLWSSYTAQGGRFAGLGGGAGFTYTGATYADEANTVELDAYTTVDAALWWRPEASALGLPDWAEPRLQLGAKNLLDEEYFLGANGFNSVEPGAPRTLYVEAGVRF